ncbi:MAG: hypothetical protein IKS80_04460 [Bacteroidaceae bacterium]|nr:hypothetical protein [Bacteroidaceae bacterium]MBR5962596.1 hypothetical protein [Bacteroidaceae bacterium]
MKKTFLFTTLLVALILCGCEQITNDRQDPPEEPYIRPGGIIDRILSRPPSVPLHLAPSSNQLAYAQMGADFAQNLFNRLCAEAKPDENVCISPLSLEIALGMLANGVENEACTEMLNIIAGKGVTTDSLNAWYYKLRSALEATNSVSLANAIWTQKGYPIKPEFFSINETYYDAEVGNLNFRKQKEAYDSICHWAYYHTYGNIRELNLPITTDTKMVIANATCFCSRWASLFESSATTQDYFTKTDGKKQTINMMQMTRDFKYTAGDTYDLLEIPFYYRSFSMLIALPGKKYSVNQILPNLDWNKETSYTWINLHLPKFDFKTTNTLLSHLQALGIKKAFAPGMLTGINEELSISFINQDVSVRLDEKGAEMAAVTTIEKTLGDYWGPEIDYPTPIDFFVDRPFVFTVRDNVSHNLLFIGKVESIEDN